MKILVTGGAGFIGSNFIKYMLSNYKDYNYKSRQSYTCAGNLENLRDIENNQTIPLLKDICDKRHLKKYFQKKLIG